MAATNYTPIQLYYSTTASAAPAAGNLVNGELAINITDGKLYYKDNGGNVQVIATKGAGTIGGSNTQIQFNDGGALAGNAAMVFNKATNVTTLTTLNLTNALGATYGGTAQSAYAQGDLLYASAVNTLSKLSIGTVNYILTSTGSVPQWVAPTSVTVQTANNLAGGAAGSVPYQSAPDTTTFLSIGAANRVMTSSGTAPQWVTALTGLTGLSTSSFTNTSLTSGRVRYSSTGGLEVDSANLTFDGTTLSAAGLSTTGFSTLVKTITAGNSNFNGSAVFAPATPAKLYVGTGTVTDVTSAASATNTTGAITSLGITPIAASNTSVTYTNASTLYIAGAPTASTNVTITNPYSLYVAGGASYFGGAVTYGAGLTLGGNLLFSPDATYDIGAFGATRPRNLYMTGNVNASAGQFTQLTGGANALYFTAATSSDVAGTIYTVPTIQNWSVGAVGSDFQFYPANVFSGTPTLTLKTNKQVIVGESSTTAAAGSSIRLVLTGASGGGIQMYGNASGGSAMTPVAGGGMNFYSYTGAQGSESYVQRGVYNTSGNWALGGINPSSSPSIVSNIGVATYGGLYSDRGATSGAAQTLFTMAASSGSNFGQITNTGTRWGLGYGPSVTTTNDVLTWNTSNQVGINAGTPNATLEVSASFADSAIEEIARISRVGGSALYGNNRAAALTFYDQNNGTLTAAVAGVRLSPSGDYNGNIALYYNNTASVNATSVSQLTRAAIFGNYGAKFGGASGFNTGIGLAIYAAGNYTNLTLQAGDASTGTLVDFNNSSNTLLYRMGVNHTSVGTGNFGFSYGTGPTGVSWSVLSSGTFGAGNINVTNLDGGGYVRFVSSTGVNASPATTGTGQDAALRLRGGNNACLDMGMNSVNTWIQATDFAALNNNYYLHLNPNGGTVAINAGTTSPPIADGLYVLNKSDAALAQFRSTLANGGYIAMHNGSIVPLFMGFGGTLSAAATTNDGVIRYNGAYTLKISQDGTQVSNWGSNGRFNAIYGSNADPSLASSGSQGLQISQSGAYNDNSGHQFNTLQSNSGVIYVRSQGNVSALPFYPNGGGGIAYQWTVLNPQLGTWGTGSGPTINFTEAGSSPNSYSVVFNGGGGSFTISRTGGSNAYNVYIQLFAIP